MATGRADTLSSSARPERTEWGYVIRGDLSGGNTPSLLRLGCVFLGTALIFLAVGLWVMPGASSIDPMALPLRLGASTFAFAAGLWLFQSGEEMGRSEIHVDTDRGEVRVMERMRDGSAKFVASYRMEEIGEVILENDVFAIVDTGMKPLAAYPLTRRAT